MRILAPAKINLHLRVGPPRPDGFHPLTTWMATIGLCDTITLRYPGNGETPDFSGDVSMNTDDKGADDKGDIRMTCSDPRLPTDDRNLVVKAAKLLRGDSNRSVAIHLEKQIPHGGGLGGGSSDAAFTLLALNQFWKMGKDTVALTELAAQLGSDIPFFLHGPSSVCRGRGEIVRPITLPRLARWVVLILPAIAMPTPAVYRQFDAMKFGGDVDNEPDWNQWAALSSQDLLPRLVNDLEAPAFAIEPRLANLHAQIQDLLGRTVRMSGSGSSLFTLHDDRSAAVNDAHTIMTEINVRALAVQMTPII